MINKPHLSEETSDMLHRLLDKSDAGRERLQLKFNEVDTPELYNFGDQDQVDTVWNDLVELERLGVIFLKLKPQQRPGYEEYHSGRLTLKLEFEETVRHWLRRPALDPQMALWCAALKKYESVYEDGGEALKQEVIHFFGKNYEQLASAFARVADELQEPQTLRQLSARCFWGESKFLDSHYKEHLILATYPSLRENIKRRPLLLDAYLPAQFEQVLFIENQDTFIELAARTPVTTALIYLGGYRGTAMRSREPGQVVFAHTNTVSDSAMNQFEQFWTGYTSLPCYFWGDLDYAGMSILEALRKVFPTVTAWQPGYKKLLERLTSGEGHSPGVQNKEGQYRPGYVGCDYSDHILVPAIEAHGAFVDQEAIPSSELNLELPEHR